jgi:hypothetical protein
VLLLWAGVRGQFGSLAGHGLAGWMWAAATGVLLAAYVATWYAALARAPAIDVTAMLVPAAIVTAMLDSVSRGVALPAPLGLALIGVGAAIVAVVTWHRPDAVPTADAA